MPIVRESKWAGICKLCHRAIHQGDLITKTEESGWVHAECGPWDTNRALIEAGETYRSHKPSTWRRR